MYSFTPLVSLILTRGEAKVSTTSGLSRKHLSSAALVLTSYVFPSSSGDLKLILMN